MLGHLIRKEILDCILGLRFLVLSALGALIIWLSLFSGYAYYRDRIGDYRLAQAATGGPQPGCLWPVWCAGTGGAHTLSAAPIV